MKGGPLEFSLINILGEFMNQAPQDEEDDKSGYALHRRVILC